MKITLITTALNSAKTIETTIKSVLAQTHKDIEYIIVDGGSTDGTIDIVRKYEELFEGRMRWISECDKGLYDAMNKGIRMAKGDVIGILNSDDYFTSNDVLEHVASNMEGVDAVYGDVHYINPINPDICVRYYGSRCFRPWQLRFGLMPPHPSFYVRREVYEKYGCYSLDYLIASDYDLMVRFLYNHCIRTRYIEMDFVTMRIGGISTTRQNRRRAMKENVEACRRNGLCTNTMFICLKYIPKIFEYKWAYFRHK